MPRYIDADALGIGYANPKVFNSEEYARGWNSAIEIINSAPTVSPDEVRGLGEWIKRFDGPYGRGRTYCSACGKHSGIGGIKQTPPFCPNCGARMKGVEDG